MTWLLLGLLSVLVGVALWWLWDIRRVLRLAALPKHVRTLPLPASVQRSAFVGGGPKNRYVVIRWPQDHKEYYGPDGGLARRAYERSIPGPGEEIEFWDQLECRGHKGA